MMGKKHAQLIISVFDSKRKTGGCSKCHVTIKKSQKEKVDGNLCINCAIWRRVRGKVGELR